MINDKRTALLRKIQSNIEKHGYHVYLVRGGALPRFFYTIGLSQKTGFELILSGALYFSAEDARQIVNSIAIKLKSNASTNDSINLDILGTFSLRKVDSSWTRMMMLGALDFFDRDVIPALQIIPDEGRWTNDIPNLSKSWDSSLEPVWKWLKEEWKFPVSDQSEAVTNLDALRGKPVTEAMRWEDNQWELFAGAGPDVPKTEIREVPLATLLAIDQTLNPVANLEIGKGLWRDPTELKWNEWA